jgi:sarcosine oxidase
VTYYHTKNLRAFAPDRFPVWISYYDKKCFYGFPVYGSHTPPPTILLARS